MTLHYHGTPITPNDLLLRAVPGMCYCVSYFRPDQLGLALQVGQSVMGDNGAFSRFTALRRDLERRRAAGEPMTQDEFDQRLNAPVDWAPYYAWCEPILAKPENWVIIPDVIDASSQEQDRLIREWPHGRGGACPVWHMDEPIDRLLRLLDEWERVAIGSTGQFWRVLSPEWCEQMDQVWREIEARHRRRWPWVHMLRGMQCVTERWPFASVDSSDVGQNHNRLSVDDAALIDCDHDKPAAVRAKADRWNARQTPARLILPHGVQADLLTVTG